MRLVLALLLLVFANLAAAAPAPVDLEPFLRKDGFGLIVISPTGEYFAATVPKEDRTGVVVFRREGNVATAAFTLGRNTHVNAVQWVNDERILVSIAEQFGSQDEPTPTGEIYAVNADGKQPQLLVGFRVQENTGTRIKPRREEDVAAYLVDDLPGDPRHAIVEVWPFHSEPWTRAERMDVYTGRRTIVARAPVPRARYSTDNAGVVRFARGAGSDNASKLYHRGDDTAEWTLVSDESKTGRLEWVMGFAADNRTVYLSVEQAKGPAAVVALDTQTGERREVLRDERVDPGIVLRGFGAGHVPVGAMFLGDGVRTAFFDEDSAEAELYRMLERSFPGLAVRIGSTTSDGKLALVEAWSATNPGDFYLFDIRARKADHVLSRQEWFDPDAMAPVRHVRFTARDGLEIDGLLTTPRGASGKLPLVVVPHGGPFGVFDAWGFDDEAQLLARAGYAVLKANFRGSGNRGRSFLVAGARQWGRTMQDDLTDATRWAIGQGIADEGRICIAGASYGAYAALMGLVREPGLYRCAVGYVGVYDLPRMVADDSKFSRASATWLKEWIGEGASLAANSPSRLADRIKQPVLLVAGGEDRVAPIEHSRDMERALKRAGVPVGTLYVSTEGHGFYEERNRRAYYSRLLAFLAEHLGGAPASSVSKD